MSEDLPQRPVLAEPDARVVGMADAGNRRDRRGRRAALDVLAERPGPLLRALRELQIAARHVEAAGVAEHGVERVPGGDLERRRAERDDEFELEMIVRRAGGIGDRIAALPQRRRALGEIERLFAIDHMAHLARVILVVAPDAENARDGIASLVADDRQRGNGGGFEQIGRHRCSFLGVRGHRAFPRCAPGTQSTSASPRRLAKRAATNR